MPIDFLDLLSDDDWVSARIVPEGAGGSWSEGGSLDDAPVDVGATFEGACRSAGIDVSFGLHGVRLEPGFVGPRRRHDQPVLVIVVAGTLVVGSSDPDVTDPDVAVVEDRLSPGQFCVIDADTVHSIAAGAEGATYTESWPQDVDEVDTWWYPDPTWVPS